MKTIELQRDERIVAVVPEVCFGPGWATPLVHVYIVDSNWRLRIEAFQPEEQSSELRLLFSPGEAMCTALNRAVPTTSAQGAEA